MADDYAPKSNVEFETIKSERKVYGDNKKNFLEVARKKAVTDDGGVNEFIQFTRGYFLQDGTARFKKSLSIPDNEEVKEFIADWIKKI